MSSATSSPIDTATRWAITLIVLGTPDVAVTARFVDHLIRRLRRLGVDLRAVLTDDGPEYIAVGFRAHLAAWAVTHLRIPPGVAQPQRGVRTLARNRLPRMLASRLPSAPSTSIRHLQAETDTWLVRYNYHRRNHSDFMRARTPTEILNTHRKNRPA